MKPANGSSTKTNLDTATPDDGGDRKPPPTREERQAREAKARSSTDRLAEIGRLLRGEEGEDEGDVVDPIPQDEDVDPEQPPPRNAKARQVKSLVDVSKALGIPVEELYNLEVPLRVASGDRKTIKLSELKDYRDAEDDHKLDRIAWSEEREREHADIARSRAEIADLLAMVPEDKLKPEVMAKIRQRHEGLITLERQKTLRRIPEWHDEDARRSDLEGIAEHLADYGFSANALQGIHDHRMLAYMRDNWLRKQRLSKALEKVKSVRTDTPARSRPASRSQQSQSVRPSTGPRTVERQVAQVSQLLRGD